MTWRTSKAIVFLRMIGRRMGVNKLVMRLGNQQKYEDAFNKALFQLVRKGDVVWDVGANLGHYTTLLSEAVGPAGVVVAFEPSPLNFAKLRERLANAPNVIFRNAGLGDRESAVYIIQGTDELGATSRIVTANQDGASKVQIATGDSLVASRAVAAPDIIKIDVEGFEMEVLNGIQNLLEKGSVRGLGVEVHFGLLNEKGGVAAPREIERILKKSGYACSWPDGSHLIAIRSG